MMLEFMYDLGMLQAFDTLMLICHYHCANNKAGCDQRAELVMLECREAPGYDSFRLFPTST